MPKPLIIEHDKTLDRVTIDGHRYAGSFFRFFAMPKPGTLFQILSVADGITTIKDLGIRKLE